MVQGLTPEIEKSAVRWLIGAGAMAIGLSLFLVWTDNYLSTSRREVQLGETLRELRTAQTSLAGRSVDPRLLVTSTEGHE